MNTLSLALPLSRAGARVGGGLGQVAATLLARWQHARKLAETRRYLAAMDDHMLADLGVSRAQAAFELDGTPAWKRRV
jgi:uncharacterized protein YjiS (DUF1127 family)